MFRKAKEKLQELEKKAPREAARLVAQGSAVITAATNNPAKDPAVEQKLNQDAPEFREANRADVIANNIFKAATSNPYHDKPVAPAQAAALQAIDSGWVVEANQAAPSLQDQVAFAQRTEVPVEPQAIQAPAQTTPGIGF